MPRSYDPEIVTAYVGIATLLARPADITAYASGDLLAGSVTAGSVVPWQINPEINRGRIRRAFVAKSSTPTSGWAYRAHFFTAAPLVTNGDNGAFLPTLKDIYLGFLDAPNANAYAFGDGVRLDTTLATGGEVAFDVRGTAATLLYALLEVRGAYTPTSGETFSLKVEIDRY